MYNGLLLVNKTSGLSSNALLQKIRRLYSKVKAGHTGSLDPLASGMLPIALGEATKFCQFLLDADKCYEVTAQLGVTTNTGDSTGEILTRHEQPIRINKESLENVIPNFLGKLQQIPPMYSALKHQGQALYHLARKGVVVERAAREIEIYSLTLLKIEADTVSLRVLCSKGTYIRTLVENIGEQLGVGAHVTKLHRCYTMGFEADSMHTLDALSELPQADLERVLLPMDRMVAHLSRLDLTEDQAKALFYGQHVTLAELPNNHDSQNFGYNEQSLPQQNQSRLVRLYNHNHFLGLGEFLTPSVLKAKRMLQIQA